ncbi:MAG: hypothetical protein M3O91_04995 [Chloroflexota bacterium]|nr:hypothetical protein [Chloroflexota bacterium]
MYLRDAPLWDAERGDPRPADIVLRGGRVEAVLPAGSAEAEDALLVELQGAFVVPGGRGRPLTG